MAATAQTSRTINCKPAIPRKLVSLPGKRGPGTGYRREFAGIARGYCILGGRHVDLAAMFGVDENTITNWKQAHPAFRKAIQEGSQFADATVAASFYRRATGYDTITTTTEQRETRDGEGNLLSGTTVTTTEERHIPGDPVAAWRWLGLRRGWRFREEVTVEEMIELARAARVAMQRRGLSARAALAEVQQRPICRCPTCNRPYVTDAADVGEDTDEDMDEEAARTP